MSTKRANSYRFFEGAQAATGRGVVRKALACLCACLLWSAPALGEIARGQTAAMEQVCVTAPAGGVLESLNLRAGQIVGAGETLGRVQARRVFAEQDGSVAAIHVREGETAAGAVIQLSPACRYTIYCTAVQAYGSAETMFLHAGEIVAIRCTANGTHRGLGVVTQLDGNEYRVEPIGGEFYIGETVKLYRGSDFLTKQCVGKGTVVGVDPVDYGCEGRVLSIDVVKGAAVEKGQLLYSWIDGESDGIASPAAGIVLSMAAQAGDAVEKGQALAWIAPADRIRVRLTLDSEEAGGLAIGRSVLCASAAADDGALWPGTVEQTTVDAQAGTTTIWIDCPEAQDLLGRQIDVQF